MPSISNSLGNVISKLDNMTSEIVHKDCGEDISSKIDHISKQLDYVSGGGGGTSIPVFKVTLDYQNATLTTLQDGSTLLYGSGTYVDCSYGDILSAYQSGNPAILCNITHQAEYGILQYYYMTGCYAMNENTHTLFINFTQSHVIHTNTYQDNAYSIECHPDKPYFLFHNKELN